MQKMQARVQQAGPKNCDAFNDIKHEALECLGDDKVLIARFQVFFRKTCNTVETAAEK